MFLELRECKARSNSVSEGGYLLTLTSYHDVKKYFLKSEVSIMAKRGSSWPLAIKIWEPIFQNRREAVKRTAKSDRRLYSGRLAGCHRSQQRTTGRHDTYSNE